MTNGKEEKNSDLVQEIEYYRFGESPENIGQKKERIQEMLNN